MGDPPEREAELEAPHYKNIAAWQDGRAYCFTIEELETQQFIGRIVIRYENKEGVWSIAFWTHPEQQGKGFMSEVVGPIIDFGFLSLLSITREGNLESGTWSP